MHISSVIIIKFIKIYTDHIHGFMADEINYIDILVYPEI